MQGNHARREESKKYVLREMRRLKRHTKPHPFLMMAAADQLDQLLDQLLDLLSVGFNGCRDLMNSCLHICALCQYQ